MKNWKIKLILFLAIDIFFALSFFSERAALILPFFISPLVFVLFIAFFQDPHSFIKQWNGWLVWIIKLSFLLVGLIIYTKTGAFPFLEDLITKKPLFSTTPYIGQIEGVIFVLLATLSQVGFMIGIMFNMLALFFPNKFGPNTVAVKLSFFKALPLSILFTGLFTIGLMFLGLWMK